MNDRPINIFLDYLNANTDYKWAIVSENIPDYYFTLKTTDKTGHKRKIIIAGELLDNKNNYKAITRSYVAKLHNLERGIKQ